MGLVFSNEVKTVQEVYLETKPVAVKAFFEPREDLQTRMGVYQGISYCDAVRRAAQDEELLVLADSILTCQWSPVVLGLKKPANNFEKRLAPRMEGVWGYYLSSLLSFSKRGLEPDIVIIRGSPQLLRLILSRIGWHNSALNLAGELDKSALGILGNHRFTLKSTLTINFNKLFYFLSKKEWWMKFTESIFRYPFACNVFDRIINAFMADMSICRNSTVIPYQTGLVNVSHFCAGGIGWGLNRPDYMTSGFPYSLFNVLREQNTVKWQVSRKEIFERPLMPERSIGCRLECCCDHSETGKNKK